jgi:hypothetical protein
MLNARAVSVRARYREHHIFDDDSIGAGGYELATGTSLTSIFAYAPKHPQLACTFCALKHMEKFRITEVELFGCLNKASE